MPARQSVKLAMEAYSKPSKENHKKHENSGFMLYWLIVFFVFFVQSYVTCLLQYMSVWYIEFVDLCWLLCEVRCLYCRMLFSWVPHEKTGSCIYVSTCGVCAGGFNKAKSISKQCVCIIRNQAVLTSRSHITEKYVVLPYRDLHCAFASLQGDAQRIWAYDIVHVAWDIPKSPASLQTSNRNFPHWCGTHCFPGETTPSYVEHFDSAFSLQCDCPGRLHAWFCELLCQVLVPLSGASPSKQQAYPLCSSTAEDHNMVWLPIAPSWMIHT